MTEAGSGSLTLPRKNSKGKDSSVTTAIAPLVGLLYLYCAEGDQAAVNCGRIQAQLAETAIDPFESLFAAITLSYDLILVTHLPFGFSVSALFYT
jgi:hypothetical protein